MVLQNLKDIQAILERNPGYIARKIQRGTQCYIRILDAKYNPIVNVSEEKFITAKNTLYEKKIR